VHAHTHTHTHTHTHKQSTQEHLGTVYLQEHVGTQGTYFTQSIDHSFGPLLQTSQESRTGTGFRWMETYILLLVELEK
jgi:hypothetical protein